MNAVASQIATAPGGLGKNGMAGLLVALVLFIVVVVALIVAMYYRRRFQKLQQENEEPPVEFVTTEKPNGKQIDQVFVYNIIILNLFQET